MAHRTIWTQEKEAGFLHALAQGCTVTAAARTIPTSRSSAYFHRSESEEFAVAWDNAVQEGIDILEEEAKRRAIHGTRKAVYYQGDICGYVDEFSDTLLMFTLKARDRDRYSDKSETKITAGGSLEQLILASMKPNEPG